MKLDEREIIALRREAAQYLSIGMTHRARLVNEQLRLRGAEEVPIPGDDAVARQTRQSASAATRKRGAARGES